MPGTPMRELVGFQRTTYRNAQVHIKWMYAHGSSLGRQPQAHPHLMWMHAHGSRLGRQSHTQLYG